MILLIHIFQNYQKELRRIANFLGLTVTDELTAEIAEKCQLKTIYDELIKIREVQILAKLLTSDGSLPFYRKGLFNYVLSKADKDGIQRNYSLGGGGLLTPTL